MHKDNMVVENIPSLSTFTFESSDQFGKSEKRNVYLAMELEKHAMCYSAKNATCT